MVRCTGLGGDVVDGSGVEAGKPLASSSRVAKAAFTGETTTGRLIMRYASENIIPVTLELGGKSPNIFLRAIATSPAPLPSIPALLISTPSPPPASALLAAASTDASAAASKAARAGSPAA